MLPKTPTHQLATPQVWPNASSVAAGTPNRHTVTDTGCAATAEFFGNGPDLYQVGDWPSVQDLLTNASVDDLGNAGLPYNTAADYTAAMQWQARTIMPGETVQFVATMSHDYAFAPCGGRLVLASIGVNPQ